MPPASISPISNINSFNINRFMITPYGYVADEQIIWSLTLFGTTDNGKNDAIVPLGVVGWKFNDDLSITAGTTFVAGTREWIISNRWMQGVDRSMANTFFRPSYSPGVEANGKLADGLVTYRAGVWNSIQGATSGVLRKGTSMAWAGNIWWEPTGPFGLGYSDMEYPRSLRPGGSAAADSRPAPRRSTTPARTPKTRSCGSPTALRSR